MQSKQTKQSKLIYIIAGEISGDYIGGKIINGLKKINPNLRFSGVGGEKIKNEGVVSLFDISEISLIGFVQVFSKIFKLKKLIKLTVEDIFDKKPDLLITIDSPGFCFRVAKKVKKALPNTKLLNIVAPSVWAYSPNRAEVVAEIYDNLFCILPFEEVYFEKYANLKTKYIGHPIFEQFLDPNANFQMDKELLRIKNNIPATKKIIGLTLGSRINEIKNHIKIFTDALKIINHNYDIFTVIIVNEENLEFTLNEMKKLNLEYPYLITADKITAYSGCDLMIAKSGTNTLEIGYLKTPLVVAYKTNWLSYFYIKAKILIKYVSLVNIIENEKIVTELIQKKCNPKDIAYEVDKLLKNKDLAIAQITKSEIAINKFILKDKIPSQIACEEITKILS